MTIKVSAVIAAGVHLFPFRTEKLSPPAPMVLGGQPPGRVGRRRITLTKPAMGRLRSFWSRCCAFAPTGSVQGGCFGDRKWRRGGAAASSNGGPLGCRDVDLEAEAARDRRVGTD